MHTRGCMQYAQLADLSLFGKLPPIPAALTHSSWLQFQLTYTEGCSDRLRWLSLTTNINTSHKCPGSSEVSPWTFGAATQQLLAALLTVRVPGAALFEGSGSKVGSPRGTEDMLWWCRQGRGGTAGSGMLDDLVGCLHGLLSMMEQARAMGMGREAVALLEVFKRVSAGRFAYT